MNKQEQERTPLFTALLEHAKRDPIQFHIPGHKKGSGMAREFRDFVGPNALSIDLINITPLDDLHSPRGIIKEAQELAAKAFGADYTFFTVQGTTGAIITMIMSVVGPGDKILVPRNVHKSVSAAIILSGAEPVFMHPELDPKLGIAHGVSYDTVRQTLDEHPDAKGLLLINPTYFGISCDLKRIVDLAHERGIPVVVDEAHGVHIHFHEKLPLSAMQAGADMAATSVHKLGGSMTQSSVLNVKEGLVNVDHVQAILSMLTTTSTSYLLLASLDVARKNLAIHGRELIDEAIKMAEYAREEINKIEGLYCFGREILHNSSVYDMDPLKLTVSVKDLGISGYDVERILREEFNIEVELSDLYNILCIVTVGDTQENVDALIIALRRIAERHVYQTGKPIIQVHLPEMPKLAMSPRQAFYSQTEMVKFDEAVGRTFAEMVMVYPPGIPILLPGEIITKENIEYIREHMEAGLPVQGPDDPNIEYVKVVKG
ncbi:aminotransferase class I/II-fold pyridoxal phosphate-dependent enzyme [Effusibacillus lacus]|uniref:aminotransferase class I/II-fold pyridoxal phosphate-dependent enzyme n=1 Tax=Effusibacillus lacus TaxID=1348429 RepID=UPI000BB6A533|nr:aminotransferase class I/II-fold pyridoxal phosphate-dependent enzyme [Effusibacillus lacus]TCS74814.1 arginine decarboxylase [Effusibacillus lacus]